MKKIKPLNILIYFTQTYLQYNNGGEELILKAEKDEKEDIRDIWSRSACMAYHFPYSHYWAIPFIVFAEDFQLRKQSHSAPHSSLKENGGDSTIIIMNTYIKSQGSFLMN